MSGKVIKKYTRKVLFGINLDIKQSTRSQIVDKISIISNGKFSFPPSLNIYEEKFQVKNLNR